MRAQALGGRHRPLIVMTPKSMLRSKLATSDPADFTEGCWRPVLPDPAIEDPSQVETVLLCSGKVRWDLVNRRAQTGRQSQVAIIPIERLYPLPGAEIAEQLSRYDRVQEVRWVQDEPANQGAWPFLALNLAGALATVAPDRQWSLTPITRPASSAPSVGSAKVHEIQQRTLLDAAFA